MKQCKLCNKNILKNNICDCCVVKSKQKKKLQIIKSNLGCSCWFCNYGVCWQAMDFHHVYPENKLFNLNVNQFHYSWNKILPELKKCVLCCSNCHMEIHEGLIDQKIVVQIWKERWKVLTDEIFLGNSS